MRYSITPPPDDVSYFQGNIAENEAWLACSHRLINEELEISYKSIAEKLRQAAELYEEVDKGSQLTCFGWQCLLEFLDDPTYENGHLLETFKAHIGVELSDLKEPGETRRKLKFRALSRTNELYDALGRQAYPVWLYNDFTSMAERLGQYLIDERKILHQKKPTMGLPPSLSLESSVKFFKQLHVDTPDLITWLSKTRHTGKHGVIGRDEWQREYQTVLDNETRITDELPPVIERYKMAVKQWVDQQ